MDINCMHTKRRREYGKPCGFVSIGPNVLSEIDPNPPIKDNFVPLSKVDRQCDNTRKVCAQEINTITFPNESRGMNHTEGGWPALVDEKDEESMARFRKKIDKDKNYVNAVKSLAEFMENFIKENNSIDIYEEYFEGERIQRDTPMVISSVSIYQDLDSTYRSVVDLSWGKDSTKFAAVYGLKKSNEYPVMPLLYSYVWDIVNNVTPLSVLKPEVSMTVAEFSPIDSNLIVSGYISGQVAVWDIRTSGHAQQLSTVIYSHSERVTGVKWLKGIYSNNAFFSASSDGTLMSWDSRNLTAATETINLNSESADIPNLDQRYTISCVEYDESVPDNFMVGTDQGMILSFSRKFKEEEDKLRSCYNCEYGPLITLERNAFYPQLFLSCDAWSVKLWSEDFTDTPVLNVVSQDGYFTDIAWNPTRASTVYVTKTTGILEIWDFPEKTKEALFYAKLENEALLSVAAAESGNQVICGSVSGSIHLLNIPDYVKSSTELEMDLVKSCIKGSETIIGGCPRSGRISVVEAIETVEAVVNEFWWEPPERAEDMYEEYKVLFKNFPSKGD